MNNMNDNEQVINQEEKNEDFQQIILNLEHEIELNKVIIFIFNFLFFLE